jgi:hypothetical protein
MPARCNLAGCCPGGASKVAWVQMQDDVEDSPAAKAPQHASGVNGDVPNQQLILQVHS